MTIGGGTVGDCLFGDGAEGAEISNLGFEVGSFGFAPPWEIDNFVRGAFDPATFSGSDVAEAFEAGWLNFPYYADDFPSGGVASASFTGADPPDEEGYELGWLNEPYYRIAFAEAVATFTGGAFFDSFESGWGNSSFVTSFVDAPHLIQRFLLSTPADRDLEGFEDNWQNSSYLFTFGALTAASFSGQRALAADGFVNVQVAATYTANTVSDALGSTAHGLSVNYRVVLASPVNGTMPSPLAPAIAYYVQAVPDANNFTLALTASAGAAIDITSAGTGLLKWSAPYENWVTLMTTI